MTLVAMAKLATLTGLLSGFALGAATPQELIHQRTAIGRTAHSEALVPVSDSGANFRGAIKSSYTDDKVMKTPGGDDNPLWSIPLSTLAATRERPIFSLSRRPPPALGVTLIQAPTVGLSSQTRGPNLALLGAIVGETEGIAIFVDETTKNIVRLKTGEGHMGWILSLVKGREVTMQHDHQTAIIAIANAPSR